MSIIVYGPQGCGKSRNAMRLLAQYRLSTLDDDCWTEVYDQVRSTPVRFKSGTTLYLTALPPPADLQDHRRIVPYWQAVQAALAEELAYPDRLRHAVRCVLTHRNEASVATVLADLGLEQDHWTFRRTRAIGGILGELGWARHHQAGSTWVYRPPVRTPSTQYQPQGV